jgi:maleate isomerase
MPGATKVTTNGIDCVLALRASGVTHPFLVFPPWFSDAVMARGVDYFAEKNLLAAAHIRLSPGAKWQDVRPDGLYGALMHVEQRTDLHFDQILAACPKDADGVLIIGTGVRCVGIIDNLETALARPVVTANQASLWRCLSLAGVESIVPGYGALLQMPRETGV